MNADYDATFILAFDGSDGFGTQSLDFDTYEAAERQAYIAQRPCTIREFGIDLFTRKVTDRIRFVGRTR